ncbi:hypothetical protein DMENIID0001_052930 [Sergentomyia squamirostris]
MLAGDNYRGDVPPVPPLNQAHFPYLNGTNETATRGDKCNETEILRQGRRFINISRKDGRSMAMISPFAVEKDLNQFGEVADVVRKKDGKLLVEAATVEQAAKILTITKIADNDVEAVMCAQMNTCRAIVRDEYMIYWDQEELLRELAPQGVIAIKNIKTRARGQRAAQSPDGNANRAQWNPTATFIITFDLPSRPQFLRIGYARLQTRDYIPDPIRCFNCQQFGHFRTSCRNVGICVRCSEKEHRPDPCKGGMKCINCKGPHFASWRVCPVYKEEFKIQEIKVKYKITYSAAAKIYKDFYKKSATMAEMIRSGQNPLAQQSRSRDDECEDCSGDSIAYGGLPPNDHINSDDTVSEKSVGSMDGVSTQTQESIQDVPKNEDTSQLITPYESAAEMEFELEKQADIEANVQPTSEIEVASVLCSMASGIPPSQGERKKKKVSSSSGSDSPRYTGAIRKTIGKPSVGTRPKTFRPEKKKQRTVKDDQDEEHNREYWRNFLKDPRVKEELSKKRVKVQ